MAGESAGVVPAGWDVLRELALELVQVWCWVGLVLVMEDGVLGLGWLQEVEWWLVLEWVQLAWSVVVAWFQVVQGLVEGFQLAVVMVVLMAFHSGKSLVLVLLVLVMAPRVGQELSAKEIHGASAHGLISLPNCRNSKHNHTNQEQNVVWDRKSLSHFSRRTPNHRRDQS